MKSANINRDLKGIDPVWFAVPVTSIVAALAALVVFSSASEPQGDTAAPTAQSAGGSTETPKLPDISPEAAMSDAAPTF